MLVKIFHCIGAYALHTKQHNNSQKIYGDIRTKKIEQKK